MAKDDDILEEAREVFQACEDRESDNRDAAEDDLEFGRLGKQWSAEDEEQRREDGRPCLTINRMPAFIRQVVNDARQNTPQIVVRPVDGDADPETADMMSGLIKDIESQSDADIAYETGLEYAASCGLGYFRFNLQYVDDSSFDQDIRIGRIPNPFSVYGDPYSDAPDSADWNVAFVLDKMNRKMFERRYKDADLVSWSDPRWEKCNGTAWKDGEDITYAEYWTRSEVKEKITALTDGSVVKVKDFEKNLAFYQAKGITPIGQTRDVLGHQVTQRMITAHDVLSTTEWAGRFIPIVPVYGEDINVLGKRHLRSLIRDAKDPQRMFNYWRTVSTEMVAMAPRAPWVGVKGQFKSDPNWANAHKSSLATLEYDNVQGAPPPQRQPFVGTPVGVINEALAASDDMKSIIGLHDASLGARSNETSGKAIMARQREGDVSTFHFQDNLNRAVRHGGRILIDLIPKVYSAARVVRIIGPDKKPKMVHIGKQPGEGEALPEGVDRIYDLTVGRYDLAVDAGPSFTTRREEAATQMMELIRVYPAAAPVIGDLLAENLDWPGATEIARRLKAMLPPQLQTGENGEQGAPQQPAGPPPEILAVIEQGKQMIADLQQQLSDANGQLDEAKAQKWAKEMQVHIDAYEAQTGRMKIAPGQTVPGPIPGMAPAAAPMPPQPMVKTQPGEQPQA